MEKTNLRELKAGDIICNKEWGNKYSFNIGTFHDYTKDDTPEQRREWLVSRPNQDLVYVVSEPAVLTSSPEYNKEKQQRRNSAISLTHGEFVEIEGSVYKVVMLKNGFRYSDGIKFEFIS